MNQERPVNNFGIAIYLTLVFITGAAVLVLVMGKDESFQLINGSYSATGDFFFKYFTYTGDGWMWLVVFLFCFFFKRKYLVAAIAGILISTLLSQFLKRVIFPEDLRPITYAAEHFPVHVVEGVSMKRMYSFPSGHASAAFTMALIMAHMINKKTWSVILPVAALLAGYSRVYLAQHFLTDVLFGMCIGFVSAILSLLIYRNFSRYITKKALKSQSLER